MVQPTGTDLEFLYLNANIHPLAQYALAFKVMGMDYLGAGIEADAKMINL